MIKLNRIFENNFPVNFTEPNKSEWELDLLLSEKNLKKKEIEKHSFKSSRWKGAKPNLVLESNNKCAYCESSFNRVAFGDVEHYRPKSKYFWLAYSYHNYLASCTICNSKFKGNIFPIQNNPISKPSVRSNSKLGTLEKKAGNLSPDPLNPNPSNGEKGQPLNVYKNQHTQERPLCINPYMDDPSDYFAYEHNDKNKKVTIVPLEDGLQEIVQETIKTYGLNRKELKEYRYNVLLLYRTFKHSINESIGDIRLFKAWIKGLNSPQSSYSGMINYYEKSNRFYPVTSDLIDQALKEMDKLKIFTI